MTELMTLVRFLVGGTSVEATTSSGMSPLTMILLSLLLLFIYRALKKASLVLVNESKEWRAIISRYVVLKEKEDKS